MQNFIADEKWQKKRPCYLHPRECKLVSLTLIMGYHDVVQIIMPCLRMVGLGGGSVWSDSKCPIYIVIRVEGGVSGACLLSNFLLFSTRYVEEYSHFLG